MAEKKSHSFLKLSVHFSSLIALKEPESTEPLYPCEGGLKAEDGAGGGAGEVRYMH